MSQTQMSQAYVIEVSDRTAGIVVGDNRGFCFFSSDRAFDGLDGGYFGSARAAERAVRAHLQQRHEVRGRATRG
ncbi:MULTISPECIES: hypothetical protein [Bradyrhizobium]|jgi:hypothetical protein|uniref:hypothetical protein n=1 Tax=Bradyrhizobium TaxID=374 RepID=UPI0004843823|nr:MULTISPECIES: hypothetical protein [Bradyrhizobium]MCS3451188.1 hypothetical protein [Bradyrhizobium elkanii]MCS3566789.1 hypothetical protein [Bradyrhizobium elkanii]MCW2152487.1 hypothetical protein [Bradyrhizobium elkanii]MCW2357636.1 hypothetical protein [Bradyrhizobium elkanii]MCW2376217.1 hypothetical protein [Bradyrhizobium elkanii]